MDRKPGDKPGVQRKRPPRRRRRMRRFFFKECRLWPMPALQLVGDRPEPVGLQEEQPRHKPQTPIDDVFR